MSELSPEPVNEIKLVNSSGDLEPVGTWKVVEDNALVESTEWRILDDGNDSNPTDEWPKEPLVGTYDGAPGASPPGWQKTLNTFNHLPQIASSYYVMTRINQTAQRNMANQGVWALIDYQTRLDANQNNYLVDMANRSGPGYAAMQQFIDDLLTLLPYHEAAGTRILASLDHEFENNWHQGRYGSGVTPAAFAAASSNFWFDLREATDRIFCAYWVGYYNIDGSNQDDAGQVDRIAPLFTTQADIWLADPYSESANQTFTSLVTKYMNKLKAIPTWQQNQHIKLGIGETSIRGPGVRSDADGAIFYANWHQQMKTMQAGGIDIKMAINFNRTVGIAQEITPGSYPNSCAAFAGSLAGN